MDVSIMRICRFISADHAAPRVGLLTGQDQITDLSSLGIREVSTLLNQTVARAIEAQCKQEDLPLISLKEATLLAPVDHQEVWAAGVTYLRSKSARMEESDFSATAYDRVYDAPRPEIFFKSLPHKVVADGEPVGIRRDATWNVPEPELALVLDPQGTIVGFSIGNDMSSRDIEGENLLYLPQAKMYDRSCSLGPWLLLGGTEEEARTWTIRVVIRRQDQVAFEGETSIGQIKRSFQELADYLFRSQSFPSGAVLLTGTGVVPADDFTLEAGDRVSISISGIGTLENPVIRV